MAYDEESFLQGLLLGSVIKYVKPRTLPGIPFPVKVWENADLTFDNPDPPTMEEVRTFLYGYLDEIIDGGFSTMDWGTKFQVWSGDAFNTLWVYTASGTSSAIYRYRLRMGTELYAMRNYTAGTAALYPDGNMEHSYDEVSPAVTGKYMLFLCGRDNRIIIFHAYFHDASSRHLEFEWFIFPNDGTFVFEKSGNDYVIYLQNEI